MKPTLVFTVDVMPSADIRETADDMARLALLLGVVVRGEFNGIPVIAAPGVSGATLLDFWRASLPRGPEAT